VRQAPRTAFDHRPRAREPEPALFADVLLVLAYISFAAYLFNGYAIRQFLAEFTRLVEKFL